MIWNSVKKEFVELDENHNSFYDEVENICKKYDLSISHEDIHGSFRIDEYDEENINWLREANINH